MGNRVKTNAFSTYIGAAVVTAIYLAVVFWFKNLDVWNKSFDDAGAQYFIYNLLRVVILLFYGWIMYYAGNFACRWMLRREAFDGLDPADGFLASSFAGAAIYTIIMFLLGLLRLYYIGIALVITAPVVFFSYARLMETAGNIPASFSSFYRGYFKQETKLNMFLAVSCAFIATGQLLYILVSKGLMPDLLTNDTIGHYIPYYQEVLRTHGIWMNKYFYHFYVSKGAGTYFLAQLLGDVQSAQLASFYFFFIGGLTLYAYIKRITRSDLLWMLSAVILCFSSTIFLNENGSAVAEFSKPHLLIGAFISFIVYSGVISLSLPPERLKAWQYLQTMVLVSLIIISPVSAAFVLPWLVLQLIVSLFTVNKASRVLFVLPVAATIISFAGMLVFNYLSSGMAEATPLPLFYKFSDTGRLAKWLSLSVVQFQILMNNLSGEGAGAVAVANLLKLKNVMTNFASVLHDASMAPQFAYFPILPIALALIAAAVRRKEIDPNIISQVWPMLSMLALSWVLLSVTEQLSIYRYTIFLTIMRDGLYLFIFYFLARNFAARFYKKVVFIPIVIILIFSCMNFYSSIKRQTMPIEDKINFLTGNTSYADLYEKKWGAVKMGLTIQDKIGSNKKVVVMNFLPALYGMPKSEFERPLMNDYNTNGVFEKILFGSPEQAMNTLQALNINYFLFAFDKPLLFTAYSPLFDPQNAKKYFKYAGSSATTLLLTWRAPGEPELPDPIVAQYRNLYEASKMGFYAKTYYNMKALLYK